MYYILVIAIKNKSSLNCHQSINKIINVNTVQIKLEHTKKLLGSSAPLYIFCSSSVRLLYSPFFSTFLDGVNLEEVTLLNTQTQSYGKILNA